MPAVIKYCMYFVSLQRRVWNIRKKGRKKNRLISERRLPWVYFMRQREWSFLLLLWGLSDPRIAELREMPQSFSIKLHSETQVSGPLGMAGGISPRHAQKPLSGERRKTLSITHHALSPPPSHHHLYIIHLINWLQRFYRIIMSLKRPFVPKSDVKQWFTTTTTSCDLNN